jgi:hypothetical protein
MRRFLGLLLLSALSVPALAANPPKVKTPHQHHPRMTWEAHFAQANLAHDGHLTLAEAKGGDTLVAKHFDEIDTTRRGYVTEDDVRVWREQHKTPQRRAKTSRAVRPGAMQPSAEQPGAGLPAPVAAAAQTMARPSGHPAAPASEPAKD